MHVHGQPVLILLHVLLQVISLGHKESITILQVKQNCEMESHEEKLHNIIIQACAAQTRHVSPALSSPSPACTRRARSMTPRT
jgi:hypothetical protein